MALRKEPLFDVAIPGQGLTAELGSRPWQQPPAIATVDEAIEYYTDRLTDDAAVEQIIDILEMGVPVANAANALQLGAVMEGVHSVDVGILVMPVIMELMMYIGDVEGIEYDKGTEKRTESKVSSSKIAKATQDLKKKMVEKDTEQEIAEEPEVEEVEEKPQGLMARRK